MEQAKCCYVIADLVRVLLTTSTKPLSAAAMNVAKVCLEGYTGILMGTRVPNLVDLVILEYAPGYPQSTHPGTPGVCTRVSPEYVPGYPQSMYHTKHTLGTVSQIGDCASQGFSNAGPQLQSSIHLARASQTEERKNKKTGGCLVAV